MKSIIRDLTGGLVIIAAAVVIGVLHNAVRGQSIPLVQRVDVISTAGHGGGTADAAETEMPEGSVGTEEVKNAVENADIYIVDARASDAYEAKRIPGAINIPYDRIPEYYDEITTIPVDARVICYCWGPNCDFSDQLATELKIMGYTNVVVFTGGMEDWEAAGHPFEIGKGGQ
jgi:rhodanese-related sulfurtransferase